MTGPYLYFPALFYLNTIIYNTTKSTKCINVGDSTKAHNMDGLEVITVFTSHYVQRCGRVTTV